MKAIVHIETAEGRRAVEVGGRTLWALYQLAEAGSRGCTPIEDPAPRWSHYVFRLRGLGFPIETVREPHGGPFPGHHARYVLHCSVIIEPILEPEGAA